MKKIELTRGLHALVSDRDFKRVNQYSWHAVKTAPGVYYAARSEYDPKTKKKRMVLMHRFILDAPPELDTDHRNRSRLDNQRRNIRLATRGQNLSAKPTLTTWQGRNKTSPFRGVSWGIKKWTAQISLDGKKKHLGCFFDPAEAARAYDKAAFSQFGKFAQLNFV